MTILKEGAGGIWHIYDKDTGKGKRIVVRTSHSMQRSKTLKAWQAHFAKAAHEQKAIATAPYPYGRAFFTSSSAFSSSSLHLTRPLRASTRLASSAASLATSAAASSRPAYLDRAMSGSGPLYW